MTEAFIFDLDGVIVDTAIHHYAAWKKLANSMGFEFSEKDNERLKGVSRVRSLEIVLELGGKTATPAEKEAMAQQKNEWYLELINHMTPNDVLPGARRFVEEARAKGYKTAIGSASKNTPLILEKTGMADLFDAIIDGNKTSKAKPDPEVFLLAASALGAQPSKSVVFEDAVAGVEAAKAASMYCVGVGQKEVLTQADRVVVSLAEISVSDFE